MILAILMDKYKQSRDDAHQRFHQVLLIFKPDTVLGWHRKFVRHKWTFKRKGNPGRPRMTAELEALIVRLAKENPRWGYEKIQGELLKLGYKPGSTSVRSILKKHGIAPAPQRSTGSWLAIFSR
jgi:transposase